MRIVGIGPKEYVGASRVLRELSNIGVADFVYLQELELPLNCDLVVLAGFHPSYNVLLPKIKAEKWILWTSPLLQAELAEVEISYLEYLLRNDDVEKVWIGSRSSYEVLKDVTDKVFYCPYPICVESILQHKSHVEKENAIGMFLPWRNKQKNVYTQLASIRILQRTCKATLYTNGMTSEQRRFANVIRLKYKDVGFLPEENYFHLLRTAKLTLNVFLSESFCYVVADSMAVGTIPIVSVTVAENFSIKDTRVVVNNCDSPLEMAEKAKRILTLDDEQYEALSVGLGDQLRKIAKRNNEEVIKTLGEANVYRR